MIKIKDLTCKNFMSVGNQTQAVDFDKDNLTLVLGENLDQGGDDSGPTPVEYLLTAIGGCVSITLRMYAERKKWDVGKITVNVIQKEELTSEGIKKPLIEEISFENEITLVQTEKLLEIAGKCPVAQMVKGETEINSKII